MSNPSPSPNPRMSRRLVPPLSRMLPRLSLQPLVTFPIHPMSTTLSCPLLTTKRIPPAQATFLSNNSPTSSRVTPVRTKHDIDRSLYTSVDIPYNGIPYNHCSPRHVTSVVPLAIQLPTLSLLVPSIAHNLITQFFGYPWPFLQ